MHPALLSILVTNFKINIINPSKIVLMLSAVFVAYTATAQQEMNPNL